MPKIIGRDYAIAIGLPYKKWFLHSITFDKDKWTKEQAKTWLKENDHYYSRFRQTETQLRWNQRPEVENAKYRTKKLGSSGINLIYEYYS